MLDEINISTVLSTFEGVIAALPKDAYNAKANLIAAMIVFQTAPFDAQIAAMRAAKSAVEMSIGG